MNSSPARLSVFRRKADRTARALEKFLGIPEPPSKKAKPLDMLIATLLSQNTNDKNSHRAYQNLRKTFPRWDDVLNASTKTLAAVIRTAGMANQKSARIKGILRSVKQKFGRVSLQSLWQKSNDEVFEELLALNGVGVKTAACVLVFSFGREVFPVDTHIHRICGRLGLAPNCATPEKTFEWMKDVVPKGKAYSFHTNLIRFGRRVCRSQRPFCGICPVYDECEYELKKRYRDLTGPVNKTADYNFMLLDNVG
jgi:endonuclease-3